MATDPSGESADVGSRIQASSPSEIVEQFNHHFVSVFEFDLVTCNSADEEYAGSNVDSPTDAAIPQDDLGSLATWSSSAGLMFNESKCKAQRITRKGNPVSNTYHINEVPLGVTSAEKDLGIIISDKLLCATSVQSQTRYWGLSIKNASVSRVIDHTLVRSHLGYATKCGCPSRKNLSLERLTRGFQGRI
ncbi:hypothetical protein pdam_00009976 [Pocillopora damicornis]|uniref:Reverse transcriptase domain-containing protein n=1 Tax=Pocillopora damicornis TaxID=46731 RepID=A0A3M6UZL4_POCDA|nr:hypothetical protein pdam_00009976 [Pocillopora damicornis]